MLRLGAKIHKDEKKLNTKIRCQLAEDKELFLSNDEVTLSVPKLAKVSKCAGTSNGSARFSMHQHILQPH